MNIPYWQQQTPAKPLYPDIAWNKPQQRAQAGKLGIIGGNRLSFRAIEHSYTTALATGVGQARVVLPDALRGTIPTSVTDTIFAASNSSGSLGNEAWPELQALTGWADALLLIGDAGRNSQTAIVYEKLVSHTTTPLIISRDAVDLLMPSAPQITNQTSLSLHHFHKSKSSFALCTTPKSSPSGCRSSSWLRRCTSLPSPIHLPSSPSTPTPSSSLGTAPSHQHHGRSQWLSGRALCQRASPHTLCGTQRRPSKQQRLAC